MTILDYIVNKLQLSDVGLVFSLSLKPQITDIKHHRGAARVPGFGGLVFLSNKKRERSTEMNFSPFSTNPIQLSEAATPGPGLSQPTLQAAHNL